MYCIVYLKFTKRVDLKCSHNTHPYTHISKGKLCKVMDV